MSAISKQSADQFLVRFAELSGGGLLRLFRDPCRQVDPFIIGRSLVQVMKLCSVRSARGRVLLWNEYRVVLCRDDFEPLRALQNHLMKDLEEVLAQETRRLKADLVGDLCIHLVVDETNELPQGQAVVRVGFASNERITRPEAGEMTIRLDSMTVSGEIGGQPLDPHTIQIQDPLVWQGNPCSLRWPTGNALVQVGIRTVLGRPHPSPPVHFIALDGASYRINKEQCWLLVGPSSVAIGRFSSANPVEVGGAIVAAATQVDVVDLPVEISLSRGSLILTLART